MTIWKETTWSIWKFPIEVVDLQTIRMPRGTKLLTVQVQGDQPCIWALVNPDNRDVPRVIRCVGTGHDFDGKGEYLGTFQLMDGGLIFHVFDLGLE